MATDEYRQGEEADREMSGSSRRVVARLGMAAVQFDAGRPKGPDETLRSFAEKRPSAP